MGPSAGRATGPVAGEAGRAAGASLVLRAHPAVRRGSCSSVVVPGAAVFRPLWSFLSSWPGRFLSCREQALGVPLDAEQGAEGAEQLPPHAATFKAGLGTMGRTAIGCCCLFRGSQGRVCVDQGLSALPL